MNYKKAKLYIFLIIAVLIIVNPVFFLSGCRNYDKKLDVAYFFKTEPEKTVLDFIHCLNNYDPEYIYNNFLMIKDKNNISKEKFIEEFSNILEDVDSIAIKKVTYLGYDNEMSKVVAEFDVKYKNGETVHNKKYIYLVEESGKWKIVFDKTFI